MPYSDKQIGIMESAEALLPKGDFAGTSVRDIADKDVNLGHDIPLFWIKEKLLESLLPGPVRIQNSSWKRCVGKTGSQRLDKGTVGDHYYIEKFYYSRIFKILWPANG